MKQTNVLVIGSGLAGLIAALTAAEEGNEVILLTKTNDLLSGNTSQAQGGIIYRGETDSPQMLVNDLKLAGDGHCWEPAIQQLATLGPKLIDEILVKKIGVNFDKNGSEFDLTAEGAHSLRRIVHNKDKTGEAIQVAVIKKVKENSNITILTNQVVFDLLTLSHHSKNSIDIYEHPACFGAYVFDNNTKTIYPIFANRTILATGGLGQIFLHTTNPAEATGDGIALAWRAGARCFNLEYIQFHPTALFEGDKRFLISEAVRGEGGVLVDKNGNEFMQRFHPQKSLAPRDIVARSIHKVMLETSSTNVFIDITHKSKEWLQNRFPTIYQHCFNVGIDMASDLIPVVPAAHYSCGGVGVSLRGRTSLRRLYAVGEISCTGVHGANRLASSSLLEALVWGYLAGKDTSKSWKKDDYFPAIYEWVDEKEEIDPALIFQDWTSIKYTMWNYVGLIRTKERLHRAQNMLRNLQLAIEGFYRKAKMSREIIELRNGLQAAIAVTNATVESPYSRGTHYLEK
ncbi:MAG: L-aspartate oxidase [Ignavibacteria bacterium]|jgi:L-aspartate oxidase|nr:L-aspartate oxidase [Ignavibacteria bacterium]